MITYFKLKKWREHGPGTISIEYEYVQKSENESDTCTSTKYKCSWPMAHGLATPAGYLSCVWLWRPKQMERRQEL